MPQSNCLLRWSCSLHPILLNLTGDMNDRTDPKLAKWPFFLGDAVLITLAGFIYSQGRPPGGHWETAFVLVCCVVGAGLSVIPYLLEYQALVRLSEARSLVSAADQMKNIESHAGQINSATANR